jgi:hypothetical protein
MTPNPCHALTPSWHARVFALLLASAMLLGGCSGGEAGPGQFVVDTVGHTLESDATPVAGQKLTGLVLVEGPVSAAQVDLWAPDGTLLGTTSSDANGVFSFVAIRNVPRDFLVVASGGTHRGESFSGTLLLVHTDYSQVNSSLVVNIPSTIQVRHLEAALLDGGQATPDLSAARTRQYLGLPEDYGLSTLQSSLFDPGHFLLLHPIGDLDTVLASISREMVANPGAERGYGRLQVGVSPATIAVPVAKYGLTWLSQYNDPFSENVSGWGLSLISLVSPPDYSSRFDRIDASLSRINAQLSEIQGQIEASEARVTSRLSALGAEVRHASLVNQYVTVTATSLDAKSTIRALNTTYQIYMSQRQGVLPSELDDFASTIIREVPWALTRLHELQMGSVEAPDQTSAIRVWHKLVAASHSNYPVVDSGFFDAIHTQQDAVAGLQIMGLNLLMEAYNYNSIRFAAPSSVDNFSAARSSLLAAILSTYGSMFNTAQAKVFAARVDKGLIVDLGRGRAFVRYAATFPYDGSGCSGLRLSWTDQSAEGQFSLNEPSTTVPDCTLAMANGVAAFNRHQPFGFGDWTLGSWPRRSMSSLDNYDAFVAMGFDLSANLRLGRPASSVRATTTALFVDKGSIVGRLPLYTSSSGDSTGLPHTTLGAMWTQDGRWPLFLFSRPFAKDPLTSGCSTSGCVFH